MNPNTFVGRNNGTVAKDSPITLAKAVAEHLRLQNKIEKIKKDLLDLQGQVDINGQNISEHVTRNSDPKIVRVGGKIYLVSAYHSTGTGKTVINVAPAQIYQ